MIRNPNAAGTGGAGIWTGRVPTPLPSEPELKNGEFRMLLEDFLASFNFTNICKYNDDDHHSYAFKNKPVPQMSFFEFELDKNF